MRPFKPQHYFDAALERIRQAHVLYQTGRSYALAIYTAGLAAECMLRAFKGRQDHVFDEHHDLVKLLHRAASVIRTRLSEQPGWTDEKLEESRRDLNAAVNDVYRLWSNDCRFASESRLRSHFGKQPGLRRGIRGDLLKAIAGRVIGASQRVIAEGEKLWTLF